MARSEPGSWLMAWASERGKQTANRASLQGPALCFMHLGISVSLPTMVVIQVGWPRFTAHMLRASKWPEPGVCLIQINFQVLCPFLHSSQYLWVANSGARHKTSSVSLRPLNTLSSTSTDWVPISYEPGPESSERWIVTYCHVSHRNRDHYYYFVRVVHSHFLVLKLSCPTS